MQRLEVFHNQCVRGVLSVCWYQQWRNHISSEQRAVEFGMCNGISGLLVQCRLRWLGHVAWMKDDRLPKQLLFRELLIVRPRHWSKLRWTDVIVKDVQRMGLYALNWYVESTNVVWAVSDHLSGGVPSGPSVVTDAFVYGCGRTFGRSSDLTRHKKYCNDQPLHQSNLSFAVGWQTFS